MVERSLVRIPPESPVFFSTDTWKALSIQCYTHVGVGQKLNQEHLVNYIHEYQEMCTQTNLLSKYCRQNGYRCISKIWFSHTKYKNSMHGASVNIGYFVNTVIPLHWLARWSCACIGWHVAALQNHLQGYLECTCTCACIPFTLSVFRVRSCCVVKWSHGSFTLDTNELTISSPYKSDQWLTASIEKGIAASKLFDNKLIVGLSPIGFKLPWSSMKVTTLVMVAKCFYE